MLIKVSRFFYVSQRACSKERRTETNIKILLPGSLGVRAHVLRKEGLRLTTVGFFAIILICQSACSKERRTETHSASEPGTLHCRSERMF